MFQDYYVNSMLDTMINPVCYKDRNGIYLGVNKIFARQITGLPEEEIVGYTLPEVARKVAERFPERSIVNERFLLEHVTEWDRDDTELLKRGGTSTHEYEGICADDIKRTFLVNKSTLNNEKGEIAGLVTVLQDITELNEVKKTLEKNEERYRIVTKQAGQLVFDYDIKSGKAFWSGATKELIGHDLKDFESIDIEVWLSFVHPEERDRIWQIFGKNMENGENFRQEYRFRKMNKDYIYIEEDVVFLKDENGNVTRALGVMKDVTGRKLAQERLETSEEKYRSFIQNFKGIAFQLDENFVPEFMHGEVEEITGYSEEEFLSGQILWIGIVYPADKPLVVKDIVKIRNSPYNLSRELEFRIIQKSGRIKWVHQTYQKIQGKDRRSDKYQGTIYDITKRKQAEETLTKMETIRKKEIHHRIKNNLQVISSLLDLQAEQFNNRECIKDSEILEAFKESQDRVLSIALIHEELHEGGGEDTLYFSPYLERLVKNLFQTYSLGNADINLNTDLEENVFFDIDTAVPLGIIVNELVSNSLKHAFPGRNKGEIQIKLFKEEAGNEMSSGEEELTGKSAKYTLIVSDNGSGIPKAIDLEDSSTLGLQLVNILVDQLEGKIELKRNSGTEFTINFSVIER